MENLTLWYNPACSKCRKTLSLLEDKGITPVLREYLNDPPSREELIAASRLVGLRALVRGNHEALEKLQRPVDEIDESVLLELLVDHPAAIQRPVAFLGGRACIARPPENVLELLETP